MAPSGPKAAAPAVSVIVPVFEVAGHVGACIASLRAQDWHDFEAIVVDDGSTDGSGAVARAAAGADPRFVFLAQENRGLGAARNAGLDAARGQFIAFLDGDDRFAPDFLSRMLAALEATGADWVACALRNIWPGGHEPVHSAIHGAPDPAAHPGLALLPLDDWDAVIRHFPSAWNKLCRRTLIADLRFDEEIWFEDHAFFAQLACRTGHIAHLPVPLCLQTRGRKGQITAADSARVFEQFAVLDRLRDIIAASDRPGGPAAFERLATRLIFERSRVIRDPVRRARFIAVARDFMARNGLRHAPGPEEGITRGWGAVMAGQLPLSVIIPSDGDPARLEATLDALDAQEFRDFEVLIVLDAGTGEARRRRVAMAGAHLPGIRALVQPGRGAVAARNHGLVQARGVFVVFMDAGERPAPATLGLRVEEMLRLDADFGFAGLVTGTGEWLAPPSGAPGKATGEATGEETGEAAEHAAGEAGARRVFLSPEEMLRLHVRPSAGIFRRAFLNARAIRFRPGPFAECVLVLQAALAAGGGVRFAAPEAAIALPPPGRDPARRDTAPAPLTLARALTRMATQMPETAQLPQGWQQRLFARAVRDGLDQASFRHPAGRLWFVLKAGIVAHWRGLARQGAAADAAIGPRLGRFLGMRARR